MLRQAEEKRVSHVKSWCYECMDELFSSFGCLKVFAYTTKVADMVRRWFNNQWMKHENCTSMTGYLKFIIHIISYYYLCTKYHPIGIKENIWVRRIRSNLLKNESAWALCNGNFDLLSGYKECPTSWVCMIQPSWIECYNTFR